MHRLQFDQLPRIRALLRSHFLSGLLVVTPLGVIGWILIAALRWLWQLPDLLPLSWKPASWLPDPSLAFLADAVLVLGIIAALALGISLAGWVSKQLLGQKLLEYFADHIIQRIPVLRSVYHALDQLLRTFASGDGARQFNRVVYLEYPRKGLWTLAFVTSPAHADQLPAGLLNVYVPTTPNPTSGFHLIVPEAELKETDLSVEEAFRIILSLGIAQSGSGRFKTPGQEAKLPRAS